MGEGHWTYICQRQSNLSWCICRYVLTAGDKNWCSRVRKSLSVELYTTDPWTFSTCPILAMASERSSISIWNRLLWVSVHHPWIRIDFPRADEGLTSTLSYWQSANAILHLIKSFAHYGGCCFSCILCRESSYQRETSMCWDEVRPVSACFSSSMEKKAVIKKEIHQTAKWPWPVSASTSASSLIGRAAALMKRLLWKKAS